MLHRSEHKTKEFVTAMRLKKVEKTQGQTLPVPGSLEQYAAGSLHALSTDYPLTENGANPYRFMGVIRAPWLDRRSGTVEWGVSCNGCREGYRSRKDSRQLELEENVHHKMDILLTLWNERSKTA